LFERTAAIHASEVAIELPAGTADRYGADGRDAVASDAPFTLTYGDVLERARVLRAQLAGLVHRECVVAIFLPKSSPYSHAAQLAVMQAGAAFLCLDLSFPDDHIRFILEDAKAVAVVADAGSAERLAAMGVAPSTVVDVDAVVAAPSDDAAAPEWLGPQSLAYVVYTSGTTGRPKGVLIEHGSVVHLMDADQHGLQLRVSDRCVQVSSNAYDSSIEECWLPFAVGATVVIADDDVTRLGPDLVPWLREQRITVVMPTPTMLRGTGCDDPAAELPDLRIVYTGGEAITQDLVDRWARGRQLINGYGPTECTVTVTRAHLLPGEPITIGKAIGASRAHVLDQDLQLVADGEPGELCFSGPCLARGYLERDELTNERFPEHAQFGRVYRSGDLVKQDERGDLHFLGRIDTQVKVRGYRIELAAIEAQLQLLPNIREALCKVQGDVGRELIAAHVVARDPGVVDHAELAAALGRTMPEYMVPSRFAVVDQLPKLVSGKADRRALSDIEAPVMSAQDVVVAPGTPLEHLVAGNVAATLGLPRVSMDADFFDLGGNSLRAAELITRLRREAVAAELTVRDVYEFRTVAGLCRRAEAYSSPSEPPRPVAREMRGRPMLVTALQSLWLAGMLSAVSAVLYVAVYLLLPWLLGLLGLWPLIVLSPLLMTIWFVVYTPVSLLVAAAIKRVLIGRYCEQRAPVWGNLYLRNWIVQRCVRIVPWGALQGTEFFCMGLRMLGARIGKRVHVHRGVDLLSGGWDLLTLGDDVTLSQDAIVGLIEYDDGDIVFGSVAMAAGSTLDIRAGMQGGSSLGLGAHVQALSNVAPATQVPDGQVWDGVPAVRIGDAESLSAPSAPASARMSAAGYGLLLIVARSLLGWVMMAPMLVMAAAVLVACEVTADEAIAWLWNPTANGLFLLLVVTFAAVGVVSRLCMSAVMLRFTKSVAAGSYHTQSIDYLRIWLRTGLLDAAGRWLSGSLYWRWWLRFAGMRLGRNCEISTIIDVLPEQVTIGAETFFADGIYLAGPRIRGGVVTVAPTTLSNDSFLGNHAVVHAGTELPPNILIGVSTVADASQIRAGTSWFGQPPIELPQREVVELDRTLTHDPTVGLYLHRLLWETLRFLLPSVTALVGLLWLAAATRMHGAWLPLLSLAAGGVLAGLVLLAKWLLLGRVKPGTHGLWSAWCCRWDFLYMAWGMLAHGPLSPFAGTLWLPIYLRAMGMRIGKRVVLAGSFAQVVDPDMLTVEDGATIDPMFQAHTFEDRVLKIGPVHIGENATVGRATVLFYGTNIGARTTVTPHSVVMKNESLSDGRRYAGVPLVRCEAPSLSQAVADSVHG
jgi:non-ribosomal peptide synthetase-like protein